VNKSRYSMIQYEISAYCKTINQRKIRSKKHLVKMYRSTKY